MKYFCLLFVSIIMYQNTFAQQEPQISHYMFNTMGYNPGFAGINSSICATAIMRQQWVGFKDQDGNKVAPQTSYITVDGPVKFLKGGIGAVILSDKAGFETNTGFNLAYSYHLNINSGIIGIGGQLGFLDKSLDFAKFKPKDEGDPILADKKKFNSMVMNISLGSYYKMENSLYFGLSISQLTESTANLGKVSSKQIRHIYFTSGYSYTLPMNPSFELDPSLLFKTEMNSYQLDINALLKYNNKFWGGISYRRTDAIVLLVGLYYKQFKFGYSYDIGTSSISRNGNSWGSHEIMVGYCFKIEVEKIPQKYKNVRFL